MLGRLNFELWSLLMTPCPIATVLAALIAATPVVQPVTTPGLKAVTQVKPDVPAPAQTQPRLDVSQVRSL